MALAFKLYKRGEARIVAQTRDARDAAVLAQANGYIIKYDSLVMLNPATTDINGMTVDAIAERVTMTRRERSPFHFHV